MARVCVFCGRSPVTSEHVVPRWISGLFSGYGLGTAQLVHVDGTTTTYTTEFFRQQVRVVCAACNNEWMSDLESRAKDKLTRMILTTGRVKLRVPTARTLATWAAKTALILQYLHPRDRIIPDSEYVEVFTRKQATQRQAVLVGFRNDFRDRSGHEAIVNSSQQVISRFNAASDHELFEHARQGRRAYRSLFAIGHVVFAVVGHDFPGRMLFGQSRNDVLKPLWPTQGRLDWPPPVPIDDVGGFESVFEGLGGPPQILV